MMSRFNVFCTLCGRNPLKSRCITPKLLKRLGYFQQQSQKYELTLRLDMCFMKKVQVHNCAYSLETYFYTRYNYVLWDIKGQFLVILHINPL